MRMYNCHVRLNGTTSTEVPMKGVPAAEIILLRHIHGDDSVVKLERKNQATTSHSMLRAELRRKYERSEHLIGRVDAFFGPQHVPLPETLDPDRESEIGEKVAQSEATDAIRKAAYEADVASEVEVQVAKLQAVETDKANIAVVNDPGALTPAQIAERDAKRIAGLAAADARRATEKAQAAAAEA